MVEFKLIVIDIRDGLIILDNHNDPVYDNWETKTSEEKQAILLSRKETQIVGYGGMPEEKYRQTFHIHKDDPIELGSMKTLVIKVPAKSQVPTPHSFNSTDIIQ